MPRILAAATLAASFTARYSQPGTVDLAASGEAVFPTDPSTTLQSVQAGVHSFNAPGKQQYVKALDHFLVLGETVQKDEYVELPENDAKYVIRTGQAQLATAEEVAAAQKQQSKAGK